MATPREVVTLAVKYKRGALPVHGSYLPIVRHVKGGCHVQGAEIREAGRVVGTDGVEREYQILRIVFDEPPAAGDGERATRDADVTP